MVEYREHEETRGKQKWPLIVAAVGAVIIIAVVALLITKPWHKTTDGLLPNSVRESVSFTPYFYSKEIPGGFSIKSPEKDTQVGAGVLQIRLTNDVGQTVIIAEQAMPADLKNRAVQGDEAVEGAPGSAALTFVEGRTTGTLLTKDKEAMVIINTADKIEADKIKDLLRGLEPIKN